MKIIIVDENTPAVKKAFDFLVSIIEHINKRCCMDSMAESPGTFAHVWIALDENATNIDLLSIFNQYAKWDKYIPSVNCNSDNVNLYMYKEKSSENNYFGFFGKNDNQVIDFVATKTGQIVTDYMLM